MTVRPALERSSATTLWISAHCSLWAPGGVSQRICQSPCTERTAPCALAGTERPIQHKTARKTAALAAVVAPQAAWKIANPAWRGRGKELVGYCEGPIGVDPLISSAISLAKLAATRLIRQMTAP